MIYLFSGLGADERVFVNLELRENHKFIVWTTPKAGENLSNYAARIIKEQINTGDDIQIIGVSFGGIVGIEVAKQLKLTAITLISSAKTYHEIPTLYRWIGRLKIDKIVPARILKWSNPLTNYVFGVTSTRYKQLLKAILNDTDSRFLKWAIREIIEWQNETKIENTTHIHGTNDLILHPKNMENIIKIAGGGHFMILNKSAEINQLLNR